MFLCFLGCVFVDITIIRGFWPPRALGMIFFFFFWILLKDKAHSNKQDLKIVNYVKAIPIQARRLRLTEFLENRHVKAVQGGQPFASAAC